MTRTLAVGLGALLLIGGAQAASAACAGDAAASREECLREAGPDPVRIAECAAMYRDDLSECQRYERGPVMPMRRPPPRPMTPKPMPKPIEPPQRR